MEILLAVLIIFNLLLLGGVCWLHLRLESFRGLSRLLRGERRLKKQVLEKAEKKAEEEFARVVSGWQATLDRRIDGLFNMLQLSAGKKSEELADFIREQEASIVKETQFLVAKNLEEVKGELATYKNNQLKKIDSQINQMVTEVARKVLGQALDLSTHQSLVMAALEEAKKGKFFEK